MNFVKKAKSVNHRMKPGKQIFIFSIYILNNINQLFKKLFTLNCFLSFEW